MIVLYVVRSLLLSQSRLASQSWPGRGWEILQPSVSFRVDEAKHDCISTALLALFTVSNFTHHILRSVRFSGPGVLLKRLKSSQVPCAYQSSDAERKGPMCSA